MKSISHIQTMCLHTTAHITENTKLVTMVAMGTRVQECILHMQHNPVTIETEVYCKTDISSHGGESYKLGREEEVTEVKNGINTGKTGI